MSTYYLYQQRGDGRPSIVSHHRTAEEAKAAGQSLIQQWAEVGVPAPTLFACYNGVRSVEIWREEGRPMTPTPADYHAALARGDRAEILRLANAIDWMAHVPPVVRAPRKPVNYAALPREGEFDAEGAILTRQENDQTLWT